MTGYQSLIEKLYTKNKIIININACLETVTNFNGFGFHNGFSNFLASVWVLQMVSFGFCSPVIPKHRFSEISILTRLEIF